MDARSSELLAAVLADPDADAPRLVYADHLMSIGDPRGEYIAVHCAIARGERSPELKRREIELREQHLDAWVALLGPGARWAKLERGFFPHWHGSTRFMLANAARVFAAEPIVEVRVLRDPPDHRLAAVLHALPPRVRALHLTGHRIDRDVLDELAARRLRVLDLGACYVGLELIPLDDMRVLRIGYTPRRLAPLAAACELEVLEVPHAQLDPSAIDVIAALPKLRELDISGNDLDDDAAKALLAGPFPALARLRVIDNAFTETATRALVARFGERVVFR